jgi:hypothetical protein
MYLSTNFVSIPKIPNLDEPINASVAPPQVSADPSLRCPDIRIITHVEDHLLDVTEDRLDRVIVRTGLRQTDPMQFQFAKDSLGLPRVAGVRSILIERHPEFRLRMPVPDLAHELTNVPRAFSGHKRPMDFTAARHIGQQ